VIEAEAYAGMISCFLIYIEQILCPIAVVSVYVYAFGKSITRKEIVLIPTQGQIRVVLHLNPKRFYHICFLPVYPQNET